MSALRGFGMTISGGTSRNWYAGDDGIRRWADNDKPVDIQTPEEPMPYDTPDFGNPDQERSSGVIDFNEVTAGRREDVALIRKWQEKRDRNATPRTGGDEPEAA